MPSREPTVSVIIPSRDALRWLPAAVASVGPSQDCEIIVIDDGSSDGTDRWLAETGLTDKRLRPIEGPRKGVSAARNAGIAVARAPWVAFLDADDRWAPGKIAQQLAAGGNWPDAGFSFTDYDTVDDDGRPRGTNFAFFGAFRGREGKAFRIERPVTEIYGANVVGTSTALVRADLLRRLGGFDESLMFGEDWDLWLRLSGAAPVVCLHRPMTTYLIRRRGGLSTTTERRSDWLRVVAERHRDAVAGESPPRRARAAIAACRSSLVRGAADEALARGRRAQAVGLLALAMAASPSRRTAQEIAACVLGR